MKKTLTVNLNGTVFHIDEDAYEVLNDYLQSIKRHFRDTEGRDEILTDIEARIAEMLTGKVNEKRQVITIDDIEEVIRIIGTPEEFGEENGQSANGSSGAKSEKAPRRLYRDPDHSILGGVCGGLGAYFNADPVWFRLAFAIAFFPALGTSLILYLILWIIIPEAKTTAEKLEMKGEKVNISNIEQSIKEEIHNLRNRFNDFTREAQRRYKKKSDLSSPYNRDRYEPLTTIVYLFVKIILVVTGIFLAIVGAALLIALLLFIFGFNHPIVAPGAEAIYFSLPAIASLALGDVSNSLFLTGVGLLFGVPLLMVLYGGIRLIFGFHGTRYPGLVALYLWLAGLLITIFFVLSLVYDFRKTGATDSSFQIELPAEKPLVVIAGENESFARIAEFEETMYLDNPPGYIAVEERASFYGIPRIGFEKSEHENVEVEIVRKSRGKSRLSANKKAENIVYNFTYNDSTLLPDPFFMLSDQDVWRKQEVYVKIKIPVGREVIINQNLREALVRSSLAGKKWTMTQNGLKAAE